MIRVLLADDHSIFRLGIRRILSSEDGMDVVGEVGDGLRVFTFLDSHEVDVLVLDLSLPGLSGLEIVRRLEDEAPRLGIVVLTMYPEGPFAMSLMRQGAGAFITKSAPPDELIKAIRVVARGGVYLTRSLQELKAAGGADERMPHERLSPRETQVFMSLIEGKSVSETAHQIDLAVSTVSTLVSRIKDKLQAGSVTDLVIYAHRVGLLN
jgi:two-component system, NarL family, invasion response regulator UvrY